MNLEWLKDFLALAETGNFTRAAEARHASQAAFSRRIMALEAWLGATLVDRSGFPSRLTSEGERFRERAAEIVGQVAEARTEAAGHAAPRRDLVRLALPHALATGRLAAWSETWAEAGPFSYSVVTGNVHDMVTSLVSGGVDILVCFDNAQQPFHLASAQYERLVIGSESFRPYASPELLARLPRAWWGTASRPTPILTYSPGAYLGRMMDLAVQGAPHRLNGVRQADSDMADVLAALAAAGRGIAWLPDCAIRTQPALMPLGGKDWTLPLSIVAYRDRSLQAGAAQRLWTRLARGAAGRA
jgi:DNA-binding transcriptional LysR family regulator